MALTLASGALAQGRKVVRVAKVVVDPNVASRLPAGYSGDALRRELEVALETTGLFSVVTREKADLSTVLDERIRTKRGSAGPVQRAELVLNPTVEALSLVERRRRTPMMRGKDSVAAQGAVSLTVQVLRMDGSVQSRMQIDLRYQGADAFADPLPNDPLVSASAYNGPPTPEEFRALYQEMGRVFAKRVLDQVSPTLVAQRADDRIYLTRGQDAGYRVGDHLRIMRLGVEIRNPATHEVIDRTDEQIGEAKVTEIRPKVTVAQIVKSSKDVAIGDIVREPVADED